MLVDVRARRVTYDFYEQWLDIEGGHFTKSGEFAELFTKDVLRAQLDELHQFIDYIYDDQGASLEALMTAPVGFINRHNDFIYGHDERNFWEFQLIEPAQGTPRWPCSRCPSSSRAKPGAPPPPPCTGACGSALASCARRSRTPPRARTPSSSRPRRARVDPYGVRAHDRIRGGL